MAFYFLYIFVVGVLLYPHESQSFEVSDCEKKYVHLCSMNFAKVLENGDEEAEYRDVLDVHCKAYQTWERCLTVTSKSCKGSLLDDNRLVIADHMIFDKKTGICPEHKYKALEKLVKDDLPSKASRKMEEIDTDPVEPCAIKANQECADKIAKNYIRKFKSKICLSSGADEIFDCYEAHAVKCKAKILIDFIKSLERFGRVLQGQAAYQGVFAYCE